MHVCLFDIDGTLIASGGAGRAAFEAALAESFNLRPQCDDIPLSGRTDRDIAREMFRRHGVADSDANWARFRSAYLRHLPGHLARRRGQVLPGVIQLLADLARRTNVAVGLLTGNIREGARVKLSHFGLYEHFRFGGFGDHHHDRSDVAHEALANAGEYVGSALAPERVWVIGDTPLDVRCARAIGARAQAVATGIHSTDELAAADPDLLLADLGEPSAWLASLCAGR